MLSVTLLRTCPQGPLTGDVSPLCAPSHLSLFCGSARLLRRRSRVSEACVQAAGVTRGPSRCRTSVPPPLNAAREGSWPGGQRPSGPSLAGKTPGTHGGSWSGRAPRQSRGPPPGPHVRRAPGTPAGPADSHRSAQCRSHLRIWSPCRQPHCHAGHIEERSFPNRHAHERHAKSPLRRLTEGPRRSRRRAGPARAGGSLLTTAASVLKPRVLAHENLW